MPFQFQIQPQNNALQTIQAIDALEGNKERREQQRESLALRKQQAIAQMDEHKLKRTKHGVEQMARISGAALQEKDPAAREALYRQGIKQLVDAGYSEFSGELTAPINDGRLNFNLMQAADTSKMVEMSPAWRNAKVEDAANVYNATIPGRIQVAREGRSSTVNNVNVAAPGLPEPNIDPVSGRFLGFKPAASPPVQATGGGGRGASAKPEANGMGTAANNKIDEAQVDNVEAGARANDISDTWDPKFLELGTRWNAMKTAVGEKTRLWNPSEEDKTLLAKLTTFKQNALNNINRTIKELTGSAMGVEEAQRIIATLPNPGQGLLDGDSPTEFKAKLDNAQRQIANARIRLGYAKRMGMNWSDTGIPLEDAPKIYNARHADVMKELQMANPAWKPEEIRQAADRQTAREFGLAKR